ncbi:hypothetical protein HELRODRAFT_194507 [Helobdella robusta]|uniref:Uncharacterized protein n=1 Tax=Helobdella robusta TaxID=6412 RepID=T1FW48_HELRO|nr:hypothetical protein HELRODRAFT_194507 [Helobdella robusta]ESN91268.1 hypothetical protein HELRODRAFT_194507 [Helobdella robusta]
MMSLKKIFSHIANMKVFFMREILAGSDGRKPMITVGYLFNNHTQFVGLVAEWLACPSTYRVRILQFLQVLPGSRPPANPAIHPSEVGKWGDGVCCRMLTGEMAQWFKCVLS